MVHRCTNQFDSLDIRKFENAVLREPGRKVSVHWPRGSSISMNIEKDGARLIYQTKSKSTGELVTMDYQIRVSWTDCNYGGQRAWWICPTNGCGRRVAILFVNSVFACRHCNQLVYQSQRETQEDLSTRRYNKIRKRLGWVPGCFNGVGGKPKGMHWATFNKLKAHYALHVERALSWCR
jgi:hypothetical protein